MYVLIVKVARMPFQNISYHYGSASDFGVLQKMFLFIVFFQLLIDHLLSESESYICYLDR